MDSFAETYFKQFRKTPMGMMRLDPQDFGPAYRQADALVCLRPLGTHLTNFWRPHTIKLRDSFQSCAGM